MRNSNAPVAVLAREEWTAGVELYASSGCALTYYEHEAQSREPHVRHGQAFLTRQYWGCVQCGRPLTRAMGLHGGSAHRREAADVIG